MDADAIEVAGRAICLVLGHAEGCQIEPCSSSVRRAPELLECLTAPRTVSCPECGGCGTTCVSCSFKSYPAPHHGNCEPCSGSGRIERGPIAYLAESLEQVGWRRPLGTLGSQVTDEKFCAADHPVYVIRPDESPKGGA